MFFFQFEPDDLFGKEDLPYEDDLPIIDDRPYLEPRDYSDAFIKHDPPDFFNEEDPDCPIILVCPYRDREEIEE